jgi:Lon protease-like protein
MFPHVMQPIHIFEPRYVEMVEEAIRTDQLLAMSILQPGWEPEYAGRPPVFPTVCLGKIATHVKTDDGKYNLLLLGLRRAQIRRELPPLRSFRQAELELLEDHYTAASPQRREQLHGDLLETFRAFIKRESAVQEQFDQLLTSSQISLGMLADMVAFTLDLSLSAKFHLLQETNVDERASYLLDRLHEMRGPESLYRERVFPPEFSLN